MLSRPGLALLESRGEIVDSARYWIRFPVKGDKDNRFSAEIPKEWQKYASWVYPLVEFTDGYALSGMLLTRPGLDPRESPRNGAINRFGI